MQVVTRTLRTVGVHDVLAGGTTIRSHMGGNPCDERVFDVGRGGR